MTQRVIHTSSIRPGAEKDPELKVFLKTPMNQLTNDQLYRIYVGKMTYINSDKQETALDCRCSLCKDKDKVALNPSNE